MEPLLRCFIADQKRHLIWLNTLSFLENCGARKIARYEHPTYVRREVLKHAAEEFRHAHHLKEQMKKLTAKPLCDYRLIFGGPCTRRYLDRLEAAICRKTEEYIYPLVTYAIEKRAQKLYPLYQKLLKEAGSKISVMSIIKEEEGHLEEMENTLGNHPLKEWVCKVEENVYQKWVRAMILSQSAP